MSRRTPAPVSRAVPGRVLAAAPAGGRWLVGTRTALLLVEDDGAIVLDLPWEEVRTAEWEADRERLVVTEVGRFGSPRGRHALELAEPARLLALVRERVTASVVLQRRVSVRGRLGFTVTARRNPDGGELVWMHEYDDGVDPDDPAVAALAREALASARAEVGEPPSGILEE